MCNSLIVWIWFLYSLPEYKHIFCFLQNRHVSKVVSGGDKVYTLRKKCKQIHVSILTDRINYLIKTRGLNFQAFSWEDIKSLLNSLGPNVRDQIESPGGRFLNSVKTLFCLSDSKPINLYFVDLEIDSCLSPVHSERRWQTICPYKEVKTNEEKINKALHGEGEHRLPWCFFFLSLNIPVQ